MNLGILRFLIWIILHELKTDDKKKKIDCIKNLCARPVDEETIAFALCSLFD